MTSYSLQHAARILRVNPSRLRYWQRTELLPGGAGASREGELVPTRPATHESPPEQLDFKALVGVRSILGLIERGVSLRRIRRSIDLVRERHPELDDPAAVLRLWSAGSDRLVLRSGHVLEEPDGQIVFDLDAPRRPTETVTPDVAAFPRRGDLDGEGLIEAVDSARIARTVVEWFERGCELDADPATYAKAIDAYETALSLDDDFADAHCNLGAVHYNRGDRETARRHFGRCLELEPQHVEGHFNLANLLEEDGADEMALQHYQAALRSDPTYPDLHINLALLNEKLGRGVPAREHWRRYLQLDAGGAWADVARQRLGQEPRPV